MTAKSLRQPGHSDEPAAQQDRQAIEVLLSVSQMVAGTLERDAVLASAMDAAADAMSAQACSILLRDDDTNELCFHIVKGDRAEPLGSVRLKIDDNSIAGWVANHEQSLLIADAYRDSRFNPSYDRETGFRTKSVLCLPLVAKGKPLGVIQILNRRDGEPFDEGDLGLAQAVAGLIAVAIHNAAEHEARVAAERIATVGQTIAGMAHCIKNILNGLQGGSYIIDQNIEGGGLAKVKRGWGMVKRNMGLLSNIVLDMLSYSKERKPVYKSCSVNDLCRDVVTLLKEQADGKGVLLTTDLSGELSEAEMDETAIKRCLINLVGNAIDACEGHKGAVTVETGLTKDADHFTICVRDNGSGIEPAQLEKIFNPFFSSKGSKGTGLGLPVAKKIIEEHAGVLSVTSAPGEGTAFLIELPIRRPDDEGE